MRLRALFVLASLLVLGCGGAKTAPVSGKVTLNGEPLANARVNFQPVDGDPVNPGPGSFAETDANGEYTLALIDGSGPGAIIGNHRVMISKFTKPATNLVPARYNLETDLSCTVPPGGKKDANFDLKSK